MNAWPRSAVVSFPVRTLGPMCRRYSSTATPLRAGCGGRRSGKRWASGHITFRMSVQPTAEAPTKRWVDLPIRFPTNEDMLIAAAFLDAGYRLAYCADAAVMHSHNLTLRQEYRRNALIGRFLQVYGKQLSNQSETGEGLRMMQQVLLQLMRSGHPLECLAFAADCTARLLGSRVGRRSGTAGQRRIQHAADG